MRAIGNTFKLVNATGQYVWAKFHYKPLQGMRNLTAAQAQELAGSNPDYAIQDLYNAIADGDFPEWDFYIQVMSQTQADAQRWNPFDATKIWLEADFSWIKVGHFRAEPEPDQLFADIKQAAFCPSRMVPVIQSSPDKLLQGRLLSYTDTQFHRLDRNYQRQAAGWLCATITTASPTTSFSDPEEDPATVEQPLQMTGP